jgi:uncharacterized protein YndB with AHSA1/START domain
MATDGTFVLADIGGYTSFLNDLGIEHGKEITEDLLNTVLRCKRDPWKLANVEGDCIFFYREGREPPTEMVDHIRDIYKAFSQRTIDIAERATCPCGACTRTGDLSLKFVVHAGEFETQKIGDRTELVGPDVITAHRLLKNSVPLEEYVIVTDGYASEVDALGLPAEQATESLDGVGEVSYKHLDLEPVRDELKEANRVYVTREDAQIIVEVDIDAPAERVWRALRSNEEYVVWAHLEESRELPPPAATPEVHRCVTPNGQVLVRVLVAEDENDLKLTEKVYFSPLLKNAYSTVEVTQRDGRTHVTNYLKAEPAIPVVSNLLQPIMRIFGRRDAQKRYRSLKEHCEANP